MAAEVTKPNLNFQWASGGAIVAPSDVKIQTGWTAEVPPYQWENYLQNRQDNALLHLFQKGISEWDALSNYYFTASGTRSYVQGSDGQIYVAVQDSLGQNPVTDTSRTYWTPPFTTSGGIKVVRQRGFGSTQTYTPSAGMVFAQVVVIGGGAGGGSAAAAAISTAAGAAGGGGAGGTVIHTYTAALMGASASIVVGGAGLGGAASGVNTGGSGGNTTFTPTGGGPVLSAGGGVGSQGSSSGGGTFRGPGLGGGGFATGGDFNIPGDPGGWSYLFGVNAQATSGRGGNTMYGRGGQESQEGSPGNNGQGYGSGGGGGASLGTTGQKGGDGSSGLVAIVEYCTQ